MGVKLKDFTPVLDRLVKDEEIGLVGAYVFGAVWRYCQMSDGVCKASIPSIAERTGISESTVKRHLKQLCLHGYVVDLTPDWQHRPHHYKDTGKAHLDITIAANLDDEAGHKEPPTGTKDAEVGHKEPPRGVTENPKDSLTTYSDELRSSEDGQVPDPASLKVREIKALELTDQQWCVLAAREQEGKNRIGVIKFVKAVLNRPPPAVEIIRGVTNYYPLQSLWEGIDKTVGREEADLAFWERVVKNYVACGWNKRNIQRMLRYFQNHEIPVSGKKNNYRAANRRPPEPEQEEWDEETAAGQREIWAQMRERKRAEREALNAGT